VWLRFLLLILIKPAASTIARNMLKKDMRKTLLGKKTKFGVSKLAAEVVANSKINLAGSDGHDVSTTDAKLQEQFDMVQEQLEVVRKELSIRNMNYGYLAERLIGRAWFFFACVVAFQLPAVMLRHEYIIESASRTNATQFALDIRDHILSGKAAEVRHLPLQCPWAYIHPVVGFMLDQQVRMAFKDRNFNQKTNCTASGGWDDTWHGPADAYDQVLAPLNQTAEQWNRVQTLLTERVCTQGGEHVTWGLSSKFECR
jgi:hypothetical protein